MSAQLPFWKAAVAAKYHSHDQEAVVRCCDRNELWSRKNLSALPQLAWCCFNCADALSGRGYDLSPLRLKRGAG
jgi:hypothetical protein